MTQKIPGKNFEELLRENEDAVMRIKERLYFLLPLEAELKKIFDDCPGEMRNDIIYKLVLDSYAMLVIDLASLCRGMVAPGGFFNVLKNHVNKMKRLPTKKVKAPKGAVLAGGLDDPVKRARIERDIDGYAQQLISKNIDDALERLFPGFAIRQNPKISHNDVEAVKQRFWSKLEKVIQDRDSNRAHRYELNKDHKVRIAPLPLKDIETLFKEIEDILNDIRLIGAESTLHYADMNMANVKQTVKDVADLIRHGDINWMMHVMGANDGWKKAGLEHPFYWKIRQDYYEECRKKNGGKNDEKVTD